MQLLLEEITAEHTPLVWSIARRFFGRGVEPADLFQLGMIGLIKAARDFDPDRGYQFSTYAVPKIMGEIRRFFRDDGSVKVSRAVKELSTKVNYEREKYISDKGVEPSVSELSELLGVSVEEIANADTATTAPVSISTEVGDGLTLGDTLFSPENEDTLVTSICLSEAVETLDEKEKNIINLRYYRGLTQTKTAKVLGISQVQVSRIERKALLKLRQTLQTAM